MKNLKKYFLYASFLSAVLVTNAYSETETDSASGANLAKPIIKSIADLLANAGKNQGDSSSGGLGNFGPLGNVLAGNSGNNATLVPSVQAASPTVSVAVDPSTGKQTAIDPSTGQPAKIDPATGLAMITDPVTGKILSARPDTGQVIDPATGQPTQVQNAGGAASPAGIPGLGQLPGGGQAGAVYNITVNNSNNNSTNNANNVNYSSNNIDIANNKLPQGYAMVPASAVKQSVNEHGQPVTIVEAVNNVTNENVQLEQFVDANGQKSLREIKNGVAKPIVLPSSQEESLYDILGVPQTATSIDITKAYRAMALKNHPDKNLNDPMAAERFKKIQNAYSVLNNAPAKAKYDQKLFSMHANMSANLPQHPVLSEQEIIAVLDNPQKDQNLYNQFMEEASKDPIKKKALEAIHDEMPERLVIDTRKALLIEVARRISAEHHQMNQLIQQQHVQQVQQQRQMIEQQTKQQKVQALRKGISEKKQRLSASRKKLNEKIEGLGDTTFLSAADKVLPKYTGQQNNQEHVQPSGNPYPAMMPPASTNVIKPAVLEPVPAPAFSQIDPAAPAPVVEPAPAPVIEPEPAPVVEPAPAPVVELAPAPVVEPAPAPVVEPAPAPVVEPAPAASGIFAPIPQTPTVNQNQLDQMRQRLMQRSLVPQG